MAKKQKKKEITIEALNKKAKTENLTTTDIQGLIEDLHFTGTTIIAKDIKEILKSSFFKDSFYPSILKDMDYVKIKGRKYYFNTIANKESISLIPIQSQEVRTIGFDTIDKIASELANPYELSNH